MIAAFMGVWDTSLLGVEVGGGICLGGGGGGDSCTLLLNVRA